MFVPLWLIFLSTGLVMSVVVIVWAIRTHQFDDQDRARYIPLQGLTKEELTQPCPGRSRVGEWGLLLVVIMGGSALLWCLAVVLIHA